MSSSSPCEEDNTNGMRTAVSDLAQYALRQEQTPSNHTVPPRLLIWYLDPEVLKHEVSEMLKEAIGRPFLCLKTELSRRRAWQDILVCLALCPTMLKETSAMLHIWFLSTGVVRVLELQAAIVSSLADVLLRPMSWGMTMELGQKLPSLSAYFPGNHSHLHAVLSRPLSCRRLMDVISCICSTVDLHANDSLTVEAVDSESIWSTALKFPAWFYFAAALLFHQEDSEGILSEALSREEVDKSKLYQAASFYLSWMLWPANGVERRLLDACIFELSRTWIKKRKTACCGKQPRSLISHRKKLQVPKVKAGEKMFSAEGLSVGTWLREFDKMTSISSRHGGGAGHPSSSRSNTFCLKIPLGLILLSPCCVNEDGTEMLLHYASTGQIGSLEQTRDQVKGYRHDDYEMPTSRATATRWGGDGVHLIFSLLDIVEDMSLMLSAAEDSHVAFMSQFTNMTGHYLVKCLNQMLYSTQNNTTAKSDLLSQLSKWKQHQNGTSAKSDDAVDDLIMKLEALY